jgi:putative hemolysin
MEIPAGLGLLSVIVLVLANGFFVATEFAIVAVRRSRLDQLAQEGSRAASAARDVVGHLDQYIAACQLGITMASLALGWVGEPALAHLVERPIAAVAGRFTTIASHTIAVGVSFALITGLHIVIGELAPKGIALQRPEKTALWVAYPLRAFYRIFRWPIGVLNGVGNGVLRLIGLQVTTGHEMVHTAEELRLLVTASHEAGEVEASEARIASRAFRFADLTARELMTPRTEIEAVPVDATLEDLIEKVSSTHHTRLPVYRESLDDVVGILHLRDLVHVVADRKGTVDVVALSRPVPTVPLVRAADDVLEDMRKGGQRFAIVVDEYGGTAGLITLHDLMEGLVGRIDDHGEQPAIGPVLHDGSRVFEGLVRLSEFEEATGLRLTAEDRESADTLSGLVMLRLGRVPAAGDVVELFGGRLLVEAVSQNRLVSARFLPGREE